MEAVEERDNITNPLQSRDNEDVKGRAASHNREARETTIFGGKSVLRRA